MNADISNAVTDWFGGHFADLHPQLQALHRRGGTLTGTVMLNTGRGLAGLLGRPLARRLGIPLGTPTSAFTVNIQHRDGVLHWDRRFGDDHWMCSTFRPVGRWPDGYWIEATGPVTLHLTVDVINGAWHWRCLRVYIGRWRLPLWLFPRSAASKAIESGRYCFRVAFSLPVLGTVLSYAGALGVECAATTS